MTGDEHAQADYASPPCFMHEIDPAWSGLKTTSDRTGATDVARWRKAERERLLALRLAIRGQSRSDADSRIVTELLAVIAPRPGICVGLYAPIRGEPHLRHLADAVIAGGGTCALPVVTQRNMPLIYRSWHPSDRLEKGFWNIPVPPASADQVVPDVLLAPVLGFDTAGYRLGNGGGYFDRTLANWSGQRTVIGVGYDCLALRTIYPQPHDVPMDMIVTESGRQSHPQTNGGEAP